MDGWVGKQHIWSSMLPIFDVGSKPSMHHGSHDAARLSRRMGKGYASEMTRSWKIEPKLVHPRKELHSLLSAKSRR
jgi:hypothetical protein